ncbi:unnamed protein product [Euphydryas editha]|uniref:Uncharacterized protein n=1 Tax=Euphydryas editha TaxID=104508 RepID=A0AAU9V3B5_EUPED|nr:unnamed protein product [Euphydryas editha]
MPGRREIKYLPRTKQIGEKHYVIKSQSFFKICEGEVSAVLCVRAGAHRKTECKRVQTGCVGRGGRGASERYGGARVQVHLGGGRRPAAHVPGPALQPPFSLSRSRAVTRESPGRSAARLPPPASPHATGGAQQRRRPSPARSARFCPVYTPGCKNETLTWGLFRNNRSVTQLFQVSLYSN